MSDKSWASVHDFRNTYRRVFFVQPEMFALHKQDPATCPSSQSLRHFWASVNMASLAEDVLIFPQARPEDGSDPKLIDQMPWARKVDELSMKPGKILFKSTKEPDLPSNTDKETQLEALWDEAKTLLPDELQALADELKHQAIEVDLNNIGFEYTNDDGEVTTTFELYWPNQKVAVLFDPLSAPKGIAALDAKTPAHDLALLIKTALH